MLPSGCTEPANLKKRSCTSDDDISSPDVKKRKFQNCEIVLRGSEEDFPLYYTNDSLLRQMARRGVSYQPGKPIFIDNDLIDDLWHVRRARLALESLSLRPSHRFSDVDYTDIVTEGGAEDDYIKKLKTCREKQGIKMRQEKIDELLSEAVSRREEIESMALFFAEWMVKKVKVHDTATVCEIIDQTLEENGQNVKLIADMIADAQTFETEGDVSQTDISLVDNFKKVILPEIVKTQQELNLEVVEQVNLSESEEREKLFKIMELDRYDEEENAFLLDHHLGVPDAIGEIRADEESLEVELDETATGHLDVCLCSHLFNQVLPDEVDGTEAPFGKVLLHDSVFEMQDNPFLSILEKTMRMFVGSEKEEHHDLEVSSLRLGISLMVLDCLNKEIQYLRNRVNDQLGLIMVRPLIRSILDEFTIDEDFCEIFTFSDWDDQIKNIRTHFEYPELHIQFRNDISLHFRGYEDEYESDSDVDSDITEEDEFGNFIDEYNDEDDDMEDQEDDVDGEEVETSELVAQQESTETQDTVELIEETKEAEAFISTDTQDTEPIESIEEDQEESEEEETDIEPFHPIWGCEDDIHFVPQTFLEMVQVSQVACADPVPMSVAATENYLFDLVPEEGGNGEEQVFTKELIADQELVTLYSTRDTPYEESTILAAIHFEEHNMSISTENQDPSDESMHQDLKRVMRRCGILSEDEGVIMESFFSLKDYIGKMLNFLALTKEDKVVTFEDITHASGILSESIMAVPEVQVGSITRHVPYTHPPFTQVPAYPPENYTDVPLEDSNVFCAPGSEVEIETTKLPELSLYHELVNNGTMGDDLTNFLHAQQLTDSFILATDGTKIGIHSQIIKVRNSTLFFECFDTEEKRRNGLNLCNRKVNWYHMYDEKQDEELVEAYFSGEAVMAWLENLYMGVAVFEFAEVETQVQCLDKLWYSFELDRRLIDQGFRAWAEPGVNYEGFDWEDTILTKDPIEYVKQDKEYSLDKNDENTRCCTLHNLWTDENSKDFTLTLKKDGETFKQKVHKIILSCRSSYFRVLFEGKFEESKEMMEYDVSDLITEVKSLEMFIFYLYHNFLNDVVVEEILPLVALYHAADFFDVQGVKPLVIYTITNSITTENAVEILQVAMDNDWMDLFKSVDNFLLSCYSSDMPIENAEYYEELSGAIRVDNVIDKLIYVYKILNGNRMEEMHPFHMDMLHNFHRSKLLWFVVRNLDRFTVEQLSPLEKVNVPDRNQNLLQLVKWVAARYRYTF